MEEFVCTFDLSFRPTILNWPEFRFMCCLLFGSIVKLITRYFSICFWILLLCGCGVLCTCLCICICICVRTAGRFRYST